MPFYSPDRSLPQPYRHVPGGPGELVPAPYEYARRFDGVDDEIWVPVGQNAMIAGADYSIAVMARLNPLWEAAGNGTLVMAQLTSGGTNATYISVNATTFGSTPSTNTGGGAVNGVTPILSSWGWFIIVVTKTAGTSTARFHMYKPGHPSANAAGWIHENGDTSSGNIVAHGGGTIRFGSWLFSQHYQYDLALCGEWLGAMSDGQVEELTANRATADWYFHSMANPTGLWEFNQTNPFINGYDPVDQTGGGANATSITGTEVIGAGPYPWTYMSAPDQPFPTINRPDLNQQPLVPA